MKKPRIIGNLSTYTDANFEIKVLQIIANFENSIYFDKTDPIVALVQAALTAFSGALTDAAGGDKYKVAEKNTRREELEALLSKLAAYATMVAGGDKTKLMSTGFDMEKESESQDVVGVETIKVTSGANTGEINVKVPV